MTVVNQSPILYLSAPHPCAYLTQQTSTTVVVDPQFPMTPPLYTALANKGFRRSGRMVYRPHCEHCQACISVRIPVESFQPNRSQRRNYSKNRDLKITPKAAIFDPEQFDLYKRYQKMRHPDGSMDDSNPSKYLDFLTNPYIETVFYELRLGHQLVAVAVADHLADGLSAMYTFYDPDFGNRGLGIFAILYEIQKVRALKLKWLYLGYWIAECEKMNYKTNFQPIEGFIKGNWTPILT